MAVKLCTWFLSQGMMSGLNSSSNHLNVRFFSPSYRLLPASCKMRHRNLRVDLCHQANDEDDEDEDSSSQEALLDKTSNKLNSSKIDTHRKCFPLRFHHVGSCQKIVMLVYVDFFSIAILLLGGALACYGLLLCLKMSKVTYERASSEMWKISRASPI